jgi:hypothetical protein
MTTCTICCLTYCDDCILVDHNRATGAMRPLCRRCNLLLGERQRTWSVENLIEGLEDLLRRAAEQ